MSICIMHRLNKRVAVLSDVVEHGGGGGRARKTTIDRRRIPERRSRSARTSKLMYARLFFFFFPPDRSHARDAQHDARHNDYEVVSDVIAMMVAPTSDPSPLISGRKSRLQRRRLKFRRVLLRVCHKSEDTSFVGAPRIGPYNAKISGCRINSGLARFSFAFNVLFV